MAGIFGHSDHMRVGAAVTIRIGTAVDTMPIEYLYDPQPGLRARIIPAGGIVSLVFDFGGAVAQGLVMAVNTTADGGETVQLRLSSADPTGAAGDVSNTLHSTAGADRTRGAAVCLLPADLSARYTRIDFGLISGTYFDIGTIAVMPTLRLQGGMAFGATEGRRTLGVADANPFTGSEFRVNGIWQPRYADFSLPRIRSTEYEGTLRDMLADVDAADDVAWIPDADLSQAELNARGILGGIKQPGADLGIARDRPQRSSARFRLVERI